MPASQLTGTLPGFTLVICHMRPLSPPCSADEEINLSSMPWLPCTKLFIYPYYYYSLPSQGNFLEQIPRIHSTLNFKQWFQRMPPTCPPSSSSTWETCQKRGFSAPPQIPESEAGAKVRDPLERAGGILGYPADPQGTGHLATGSPAVNPANTTGCTLPICHKHKASHLSLWRFSLNIKYTL